MPRVGECHSHSQGNLTTALLGTMPGAVTPLRLPPEIWRIRRTHPAPAAGVVPWRLNRPLSFQNEKPDSTQNVLKATHRAMVSTPNSGHIYKIKHAVLNRLEQETQNQTLSVDGGRYL